MKKRILLMCALLVSVITLSGAANRSFRTEMEQWNPIGFTQASNGTTQAQSGPQTTYRLTAGSAILPTVATAAPSGELRGGWRNEITFTTAKKIGESVKLKMTYMGFLSLSGLTGTPKSGEWSTYKLTSQSVTIRGDVLFLDCAENWLTELDVSKNTALIGLYCSKNQLTALDVSKNTELGTLDCRGNQIKGEEMTRLVKSLPDRTGKKAGTKKAGKFTVVQEPAPEFNICLKSDVAIAKRKNWNTQKYKSNTKEYVPYEGRPYIMYFKTAKTVGETVELYMEYSGDTPTLGGATGTPESGEWSTYKLTSQTVTIQGDVIELYCNGNQLNTLDVSKNTALTTLDCSDNQLTTLYVPKNTALTTLDCSENQLKALDVSKNTALTTLDCTNNQLTALDVSKNTALTTLDCSVNQLTTLDVSKNTALTTLSCFNNQLTTLDVSKNTALTRLSCPYNQLAALDVSQNIALTELYCSNNQLTALDLSQNIALTELHCYNNQLTALDVSQNTELGTLSCRGNQIKGEEMTSLVNSLPDRTGKVAGTFTVVREPDLEGNICLKSDVAIAKSKNWNTQKFKSDTYKYVAYEGTYIMSFTTSKKIGETVNLQMNYTGAAPTLSGATGTPESGTEVTYTLTSQTVTIAGDVTELYCNGNQLTTLDVSKNTALTELYCSNNQLTELDVSRNTALKKLYCTNNQLTTLDVSRNTALIRLYCYNNQLTALDVSKNTALTTLACFNNPLTTLDVSKNTALTRLDCSDNQLTALDVSKNTALTELDCFNNQLTTLDVSKNTALGRLNCSKNQMTALDVSQNTKLGTLDCRGNQIKGKEMSRLVNSLPDRTGKYDGRFTVVQSDAESNRCLKSDVAIAKSKNWSTLKYNSDTKNSVPYEGEEPIPYAVTLTKEGEGTLTATGAADLNAVLEGTELTIEATPAAGYELKALTANGTDILATKKIVVTDNMTVKATFTKKSYTVTFTPEGEGKLTATRNGEPFTSGSPAYEGDKIVITAQPAEGYQIDKWLIGKEEIEFTPYTGQTTFECTVGTSDVLIKATFAKKTAADVVESSSVRLYPNPASTYVNVKGAKADALVRLYDANGTLRYEARTDADGTLQIDLSAYAEGTYLLRVGDDTQRLLIQR